jgi:hypothetical protein
MFTFKLLASPEDELLASVQWKKKVPQCCSISHENWQLGPTDRLLLVGPIAFGVASVEPVTALRVTTRELEDYMGIKCRCRFSI